MEMVNFRLIWPRLGYEQGTQEDRMETQLRRSFFHSFEIWLRSTIRSKNCSGKGSFRSIIRSLTTMTTVKNREFFSISSVTRNKWSTERVSAETERAEKGHFLPKPETDKDLKLTERADFRQKWTRSVRVLKTQRGYIFLLLLWSFCRNGRNSLCSFFHSRFLHKAEIVPFRLTTIETLPSLKSPHLLKNELLLFPFPPLPYVSLSCTSLPSSSSSYLT